MRFSALATDYDGTLAHDGVVTASTIEALERFRQSGRKLIMVTGRELEELIDIFPRLDLFEQVVVENGAVLYRPADRSERTLGESPSERFLSSLRRRTVRPLRVGRVIVATWESEKAKVLEAIQENGLELQVIFNKGSLMVLPPGLNKATGLRAALLELRLSAHNTVGVGDAENDHAFLSCCECAVAVANALPALKERADLVTVRDHGAGVEELIGHILNDDLAAAAPKLARHDVLLGGREEGREVRLPAYGTSLLVAGPPGGGKSTLATGIIERLTDARYQVCVIDPEGDYQVMADAVMLGDTQSTPSVDEVMKVLDNPDRSVVLNLLGVPFEQRPSFFQILLSRLQEMRSQLGRPHWIILDEAHHLLPAGRDAVAQLFPNNVTNVVMITVTPEHMHPAAAAAAGTVIVIGDHPDETLRSFERATGQPVPAVPPLDLKWGEALLWERCAGAEPVRFCIEPSRTETVRHGRKYAAGEVAPDLQFFFRGPRNHLNLRAQNLMTFLQIADGVDDETWLHHLRRGEYSRWFRDAIHSDDLAEEAEAVERDPAMSAAESRSRIRQAIERRYTIPA